MRWSALLFASAGLAACTSTPPRVDAAASSSTERSADNGEWSDGTIRRDLETSVLERFGQAALDRAGTADASIMAKMYEGLPRPPVQGTDGQWVYPPKPVALLVREGGDWFEASSGGFAPVAAAKASEIDRLLRSADFWAEPARVAQGGCTDGGSTLMLIRLSGADWRVRQGTCGGPPLHSRLLGALF